MSHTPPPNQANRLASTIKWLFVHVVFSLVSVGFSAIVNIVIIIVAVITAKTAFSIPLACSIFSYPTLAWASGLISLFVRQSLVELDVPNDSEDKSAERRVVASVYLGVALLFIFLFGAIQAVAAIGNVFDYSPIKDVALPLFQAVLLSIFVLFLLSIVIVQNSFHLPFKVSLL